MVEPPNLPATPPTSRSARWPMFLSAVVYPGAGQIAQGRWFPAMVYAGAFTFFSVFFLVYVFRIILTYYQFTLNSPTSSIDDLPVRKTVMFLILSLFTYILNLVDCFAAYTRTRQKEARDRVQRTTGV